MKTVTLSSNTLQFLLLIDLSIIIYSYAQKIQTWENICGGATQTDLLCSKQ